MAAFVFEDYCDQSSVKKNIDPLEITVPINVGGLTATAFEDAAGDHPLEEFEWTVEYKYYRLTKVRVWCSGNVMSGFEVTFSPETKGRASLTGYNEITQMFGSTGLLEWTEPFKELSFTEDFDYIKVIKDIDANGDQGILGWILGTEVMVNNCDSSFCPYFDYFAGVYPYSGSTESETFKLDGRLIGFKVKTGLSRSGLVKNIRGIEFITDTTNCEHAYTYQPSTYTNQLTTFEQVYMDNTPITQTVEVSLETTWGEQCLYTPVIRDERY